MPCENSAEQVVSRYEKPRTEFMRANPVFYELLKQMTLFFGDDNERVETAQPTPEMFRLPTKCAEAAARGELGFGRFSLSIEVYNLLKILSFAAKILLDKCKIGCYNVYWQEFNRLILCCPEVDKWKDTYLR